jgi:hypothetical protein
VLKTAAQELQKAFDLKEAEVRLGVPAAPPAEATPPKNGRRQ